MKKNVRVIENKATISKYLFEFRNLVSIEQMDMLLDHHYSLNSLKAMTKDWNLFVEFCKSKSVLVIPASSAAVRLFLEKEANQRKYATIRRYALTIGLIHRVISQQDVIQTPIIQTTLANIRTTKYGDAKQTEAFEITHLNRLNALLPKQPSLIELRNIAIYNIMFECALKRSELKHLKHADIEIQDERYYVFIGGDRYALSSQCSEYLRMWLLHQNGLSEYLFNAVDKHGYISDQPLDDSSIFRILKGASEKLNLDVAFSGQSLRVGAVKAMADDGLNAREIQIFGRWLSPVMPYQYIANKAQAEAGKLQFIRLRHFKY